MLSSLWVNFSRQTIVLTRSLHVSHIPLLSCTRWTQPTVFRALPQHHWQSFHSDSKYEHKSKWANYKLYISGAVITGIIFGGYAAFDHHQEEVNCEPEILAAATPQRIGEQNGGGQIFSLDQAIRESDELIQWIKLQKNCPGVVVAVTVDGKEVWSKGYGLADVENLVDCKPATVMRIASISKPLTMVAIAQLWEQGKLDLDKCIQHYVHSWPHKTFAGQKATITTRQLVSMMGGVRHYDKKCRREEDKKSHKEKKSIKSDKHLDKEKKKKEKKTIGEFDQKEYYLRKHFPNVNSALELFKNDELCSLPGTEFLYSTHAWTLLSAVVEGASGRNFVDIMRELFRDLGLDHTYLDEDQPLIPNRARYYVYNKKTRQLVNAPYVDNSYKWAGGGFLSTVHDLCHFGNSMLYSYQLTAPPTDASTFTAAAGFLQPDTVSMIWSPVSGTKCSWDSDGSYGMGWGTVPEGNHPAFTREQRMYVSHTGGAVGASSVLLILPRKHLPGTDRVDDTVQTAPHGVCVAIIVNMQSVGLNKTALKIAKLFDKVKL